MSEIFLKGKMALYTELYTRYPKHFLDYNVNFYIMDTFPQKKAGLCARRKAQKRVEKKVRIFWFLRLPSRLFPRGNYNEGHAGPTFYLSLASQSGLID